MSTDNESYFGFAEMGADSQKRLAFVVEMMRDVSRQSDPQTLVRTNATRMRQLMRTDSFLAISRRELTSPKYKITRSTLWGDDHNPWKSKRVLPVLQGGVLGEMIYGDEPRIINDFHPDPSDPAYEYLQGYRSIVGIPNYDDGVAMNMTILLRKAPNGFDEDGLAMHVWVSNLFGRATTNLVLSQKLREAMAQDEREMQVVADIQRSLLPTEVPKIPSLDLATHYQTSRLSGGDYYDFFPLPDGKWGILIADVSGHGTPAAVLMAVTHSIAHTHHEHPDPPSKLMRFVNHHLSARYTGGKGTFVTAFYGIYDPQTRELTYSRAGHCPVRLRRSSESQVVALDIAEGLPLGIEEDENFSDVTVKLETGDVLIFYTDGITEARSPGGELFGESRLDASIACAACDASAIVRTILRDVNDFTDNASPKDDMTLVVAKVQ